MKCTRPKHLHPMTRRRFLAEAATLGSAMAVAPCLVPSSVLGVAAPSKRVQVGVIGLGNQSVAVLPSFLQQGDVQVVAVCDVNRGSHGYRDKKQFLGREPGLKTVNTFYAQKTRNGQYQGCNAYTDFREVIGRSDVDAVVLIVPDHWHAVMTCMAAKAGKDIYCEKPLSLTLQQGRQMVEAVTKHKRILQTGSPWRSSPVVRRACEWVRNGRIGKIRRVACLIPPNNAVSPGPGWQPMPVPDGFDYSTWLGPAPDAPYHVDRCLYRFRFIFDYSGGQMTNFGAHVFGITQWALGTDNTGPVEIENLGAEFPPPGSLFTTATKVDFRALYANGTELTCKTGGYQTRFEGTEGWIDVTAGTVTCNPKSLADSVIKPEEIHLPVSNPDRKEDTNKYIGFDHVRNFIACVKSRQEPVEPVEVGHRIASICHLGNIAMRLRRKLAWDPVAERFPNDAEANAMVSRPLRAPWQL